MEERTGAWEGMEGPDYLSVETIPFYRKRGATV